MSNLKRLSEAFEDVYLITGNHDIFYREKREIHSLIIGTELSNIHLIDNPTVIDDVALVPWLVGDEWKSIHKIKSKYMFGHFEIPGFKMNAQISMPDQGQISKQHFKHQDYVFSGHFHKRQSSGHIHYIGNPFSHSHSDDWDFDRGAIFLAWNGKPEYVNYDNGPRHISCYLSELLETSEEHLAKNISARIILDANLTYEDANFIKEIYIENYKLREMKFIYETKEELNQEPNSEITFQSVDEIVIEQLANIDSNTFDARILVNLYNGL
jgi:DNA repair exonuclease SbcCD nuclease subunit